MSSFFSKKKGPFEHIHQQSVKQQQMVYDKTLNQQKKVTLTPAQREQAVVDYFMSAGLDYKGQLQCCYETKGGGLQIDASINPGRIVAFLSTEISLSAKVTRSKQVFLVAQRGPSKIVSLRKTVEIPTPIMINCLTGVIWEGDIRAGVEIAVGAKYTANPGAEHNKEKDDRSKAETTFDKPEQEKGFVFEGLAFEAGAKAGFAAEGGYHYEHYYAEDACPLAFAEIAEARETQKQLFIEGSYKAIAKKRACKFANDNPRYFEHINYEGAYWGHTSSLDIAYNLAKQYNSIPRMNPAIKKQAIAWVRSLLCWIDDKYKPTIPSSLFISAHKADGKAGLFAEAKVTGKAIIASANAGARVDALKISGGYKTANVRYQTVYPAPDENSEKSCVVMTQDSKIVYKQVVFTPIEGKIEGSVSVVGHTKSLSDLNKGQELRKAWDINLINSMSYITTTVYWHSSMEKPAFPSPVVSKKSKQNLKWESRAIALPGTGVAFGGSFLVKNLMKFYQFYDGVMEEFLDEDVGEYFTQVAKALEVKPEELNLFFIKMMDERGPSFLRELAELNQIDSVLLEANFRIDYADIILKSRQDGDSKVVKLHHDTSKELLGLHDSMRTLEAIRLRYRIQDSFNADGDYFSLGFKIDGQGLGIKLKKVDRAGSEGIVDLFTCWMDKKLGSGTTAYEKAVPPVALFCQ